MVLQNSEIGWREVCNFGLNLKKKRRTKFIRKRFIFKFESNFIILCIGLKINLEMV